MISPHVSGSFPPGGITSSCCGGKRIDCTLYHRPFDARATEPTTAIFFNGTRLHEQCEQDQDLGFEMMKRMTQVVIHRLQTTRNQMLSIQR